MDLPVLEFLSGPCGVADFIDFGFPSCCFLLWCWVSLGCCGSGQLEECLGQ